MAVSFVDECLTGYWLSPLLMLVNICFTLHLTRVFISCIDDTDCSNFDMSCSHWPFVVGDGVCTLIDKIWAGIIEQVTINPRLLVGRDDHLDQSESYDLS